MAASTELLEQIPGLFAHRQRLAGLGVHAIGVSIGVNGAATAGVHLAWADGSSSFGWVLAPRATGAEARRAAIALLVGFAETQARVASDVPPLPHSTRSDRIAAIGELDRALHPFCGPPTPGPSDPQSSGAETGAPEEPDREDQP